MAFAARIPALLYRRETKTVTICSAAGQSEPGQKPKRRPRRRRAEKPSEEHPLTGHSEASIETKKSFRRAEANPQARDVLIDDHNAPEILREELERTRQRVKELQEKFAEEGTTDPLGSPAAASGEEGNAMRAQLDYALAMMAGAGCETGGGQYANLIPFKSQLKSETCAACDGEGMCVCDYCKGVGFVKFGPGENPLKITFKGIDVYRATPASGEMYHCPFCGGLKKERCLECFGSGRIREDGEPDVVLTPPSPEEAVDELMNDPQRHTEVTKLGAKIVRARRRRTPKASTPTSVSDEEKEPTKKPLTRPPDGKRRRGRPRKEDRLDLDTELTLGLQRAAARNRDPTGFVNTTMYKVARDLVDEVDTDEITQ